MAETKSAEIKDVVLNQYEGMFLLPGAAASDLDGAVKLVRGIIEKHGASVMVIKKWDERKLAYEVNRQKRGLFIICYFKAPGGAVVGIERDVTLSDDIVRLLVTKADHLNEKEMNAVEPQPIQPREERNSWDRPPEPRGDRPPSPYPRDEKPHDPRDEKPRDPRDEKPRDPRDEKPRDPRDEKPREERPRRAPAAARDIPAASAKE
jgi:ribosomal protein S6